MGFTISLEYWSTYCLFLWSDSSNLTSIIEAVESWISTQLLSSVPTGITIRTQMNCIGHNV